MTATCDGNIIIVCDDPCDSLVCQQTNWVIDSGASYHITPHREMFESYAGGGFGKVKMANHGMTEAVDSGAAYYITPHREMFESYTDGDFGKVKMANHGMTEAVGIGDVVLVSNTGCKLVLRDVRHVPDIRLNIISVGKLDDEGYENYYGEGRWKLTKDSQIIASCLKQNSLYLMQAEMYPRK